MSIKVMTSVWEGFPAGGPDLLAMLCLADWCDDKGRCFPSIDSISKKLRVSRSQAQRVVHRLILAGWVTVIGGHAGGAPPRAGGLTTSSRGGGSWSHSRSGRRPAPTAR